MKANQIKLKTDTVKKNEWNTLLNKTIYWGHMSVGYNILNGVQYIITKNNISLKIKETSRINDFSSAFLAHSKIGKNKDPKSKINDFSQIINNGLGNKVNIAFFKLCYIDFDENTDENELFTYYKAAIDGLSSKYPKTKFLHITVPLTTDTMYSGLKNIIKDLIKSLIGKNTAKEKNRIHNIKRNNFNRLLINEYGKEKVFNLAASESTYPDGKIEIFNKQNYRSMIPFYSSDGGHLNELGEKIVADEFLIFLLNNTR